MFILRCLADVPHQTENMLEFHYVTFSLATFSKKQVSIGKETHLYFTWYCHCHKFLPAAQHSVLLAGSCQQDQNQVQDLTQETGLQGGTGSVTVWNWADPSLVLPYPSGHETRRDMLSVVSEAIKNLNTLNVALLVFLIFMLEKESIMY